VRAVACTARMVAGAGAVILLLAVVDSRLELPAVLRALALAAGVAVAARVTRSARPWRPVPRSEACDALLDDPAARALVRSAVELEADLKAGPPSRLAGRGESEALAHETVRRAAASLASSDPRRAAPVTRAAAPLAAASLVLSLAAFLAARFPGEAGCFARRALLLAPDRYPRDTLAVVHVPDGGLSVVAADPLDVEIRIRGREVERAELHVRGAGERATRRIVEARDAGERRFAARVGPVEAPIEVAAVAGDDRDAEPWIAVDVLEPPRVESIRVTVTPPAYTRAEPVERPGGDVTGLPGARARIDVRASGEGVRGALVFDDGSTVPLRPLGEGRGRAEFPLARSGSYHVALVDARGVRDRDTSVWTVRAVADRPPEAVLAPVGYRGRVTAEASLPVQARARDDYALDSATLVLEAGGRERRLPLPADGAREQTWRTRLELAAGDEPVREGEVLELFLEARDRRPDGQAPGVSRSGAVTLRVVSGLALLRDLLDEILVVKDRLRADRAPDALARDAAQLEEVARALSENRVGGSGLPDAVRSAAAHVTRAAGAPAATERAAAVADARRQLAVVADLAGLAVEARDLARRQSVLAGDLGALSESVLRGRSPGEGTRRHEEEELAIAARVRDFSAAVHHEMLRYSHGAVPSPLLRVRSEIDERTPEERLEEVAALLASARLLQAARVAVDVEQILSRLATLLEPETAPEPAPVQPPADRERTAVSEELRELLERLEATRADLDEHRAPGEEEIREMLRELEEILEDLERARQRMAPPDKRAEGVTEAPDEELRKIRELERGLRNRRVTRRVELRPQDFEATRDAILRTLEEVRRREEGVVERDARRERRGQNLSGEFTAERLQDGTAGALLPSSTPARAGATRPWGDLPSRSAEEVLRASGGDSARESEEAIRAYFRKLAQRPRDDG